jgi:hypothetical protein
MVSDGSTVVEDIKRGAGSNVPASLEPDKAGDDLPLIEKVHVGFEVASDLFLEAKAKLEDAAREFDEELKSKNADSKLDAGWQVAEDTFTAARNVFQEAIVNLKSQLEPENSEDKSLIGKTTEIAKNGVELSKESLILAKGEFEKASCNLRDRIKAKEEAKMKTKMQETSEA